MTDTQIPDGEPSRRRRGRPLRDPDAGPIPGRARTQAHREQCQREAVRLASEWCVMHQDLAYRVPHLAAELRSYDALKAAVRILGQDQVNRLFRLPAISVTAEATSPQDALVSAGLSSPPPDQANPARTDF